jgi:hypothetical protein
MRNNALWQIIGFNFVVERKFAEFGSEAPVTADCAFNQAFVPEMVDAAIFGISLTGNEIQFKIAGLSLFQKALLDSRSKSLGMPAADKTTDNNFVVTFYQ